MKYRLPVEASLYRNFRHRLRRLWRQLNCEHTHTFDFHMDEVYWNSCGNRKGKHPGLKLTGCYLCGQVWVEDWMA